MSNARHPATPRPMVTVSFPIPAAMFTGLIELARKAGQPRDLYTGNLLIAAYSAKCGATGDPALEAAVADLSTHLRPSSVEAPRSDGLIMRLRADLDEAVKRGLNLEQKLEATLKDLAKARGEISALQDELALGRRRQAELDEDAKAAKARIDELNRNQVINGNEVGFSRPEALPSKDPTVGLADCTRRMIIALNAAGLRAPAIARDTDTPLHIVKAVIDQRQAGGRRA